MSFIDQLAHAQARLAAQPADPALPPVGSFLDQLKRAQARTAEKYADPLQQRVAAIMRDKDMIGTAPLLDLLNMPKTTGNARRIGVTMRALGFVPIKSRRLEPGGYRDTVTRGWTRPVRVPNRARGSTVEEETQSYSKQSEVQNGLPH